MKTQGLVLLTATAALAAAAQAAPTIDGTKTEPAEGYGAAKWVNNVPTNFGDNATASSSTLGNPEAVTTGVELAIPFSALGVTSDTGLNGMKILVIQNNKDNNYLSNQWIPALPQNTDNIGGGIDTLDLSTGADARFAGNQYTTITTLGTVSPITLIEGAKDAAYGTYAAGATNGLLQSNYTQFGDAQHGKIGGNDDGTGGASEVDAVYLVRSGSVANNNATLHVFIAGNLEANNNKLELFIQVPGQTGQNQLSALPTSNAHFENLNGLKFDAGFSPTHIVSANTGRPDATGAPTAYQFYVDYLKYDAVNLAWTQLYCGANNFDNVTGYASTSGTLTGGEVGAPAIKGAVNNTNTAGVIGSPVLTQGDVIRGTGSEIDAIYSKIEGGKLYLFVAGNLETNFNKLDLFFDTGGNGTYGQNQLRGVGRKVTDTNNVDHYWVGNVDADNNGLNRMGANNDTNAAPPATQDPNKPGIQWDVTLNAGAGGYVQKDGLKFDSDFQATYWMTYGGNLTDRYINAAVIRPNGRNEGSPGANAYALDFGTFYGGSRTTVNGPNGALDMSGPRIDTQDPNALATTNDIFSNYPPRLLAARFVANGTTPSTTVPSDLSQLVKIRMDNSNVLGLSGTTTNKSDPASVTTGLELVIDLAELGYTDQSYPLKLCAFVNGGGHNFLSNQVTGGLPLTAGTAANLGEPRSVNFASIAGNQYIILAQPAASNASFAVGSDTNALTIDFGSVTQNTSNPSQSVKVYNFAAGGAQYAMNITAVTPGGENTLFPTTLTTGTGIAAGSFQPGSVSFLTSASVGAHQATYTIVTADAPPGSGTGTNIVLTVKGTIVAAGPKACNKADITDGSGNGGPDGALTASDVVKFFSSFFAPCTAPNAIPCNKADITDGSGNGPADGALTASDVVKFFSQFFAPCVP